MASFEEGVGRIGWSKHWRRLEMARQMIKALAKADQAFGQVRIALEHFIA